MQNVSKNIINNISEHELELIISKTLNHLIANYKIDITKIKQKKDLICSADLQKMLGVSRTTIYNWVKNGNLPLPVKIGKLNYFDSKDLEVFY